jgi:hypothetical protein
MSKNLERFAAILNGNGGCKDCQDTVLKAVKDTLHEAVAHSALAGISYDLRLLIGIIQRLLLKYEEAEGTPKGGSYVFSQSNPAQNTQYTGKPLSYDGVIRSLVLSGPGNVTLTLNDKLSLTGSTTIAVVSCNGNAVPVGIHHKMPVGATLSIQTDSSAGSGLLAVTAWVEPIIESNPEYFRLRR